MDTTEGGKWLMTHESDVSFRCSIHMWTSGHSGGRPWVVGRRWELKRGGVGGGRVGGGGGGGGGRWPVSINTPSF